MPTINPLNVTSSALTPFDSSACAIIFNGFLKALFSIGSIIPYFTILLFYYFTILLKAINVSRYVSLIVNSSCSVRCVALLEAAYRGRDSPSREEYLEYATHQNP
ncbi:MAG: hypothetical protein ACI9LY_000115 [Arenicella sp.]|jgi:hypothetical protein